MIIQGSWNERAQNGDRVKITSTWWPSTPDQLWGLRKIVDVYRGTEWAREIAIDIARRHCRAKDQACQALAIARAVQRRIYYVKERPERFQMPTRTWNLRAGDCDDFTTLIGALCESIGIPIEIVGMKISHRWRHVFPMAWVETGGGRLVRLPLDASMTRPVTDRVSPIVVSLKAGKAVETLRIPPT